MLQIQIVSDLHLEFHKGKDVRAFIKPSAPILALLGDICCLGDDDDFTMFRNYITMLLPYYKLILYVSGNHEYYYNSKKQLTAQRTIKGIDARVKALFKELDSTKLHYLNNTSIVVSDNVKTKYLICGSTLWSWIPEDRRIDITSRMNDYRFIYIDEDTSLTKSDKNVLTKSNFPRKSIKQITSNDIADMYLRNCKYIKTCITNAKKLNYKLIVLTHHKPYISKDYLTNPLEVAYESDLSKLFGDPLVLWAYGHTHVADACVKNGTKLYSNPKGYPMQKTKFVKDSVVKI